MPARARHAKRPATKPAASPSRLAIAEALASTANDRSAPPPALLTYQQVWVADDALLKIGEKSRRIGLTWAEAADNALIASSEGGSNVFYIGPTQDMAVEYIDACAMWARAYNYAAGEIEEGLFEDIDEQGDTKHIKSFTIRFPGSGKRIVALSSRPTNLRGKQGVVVIDEAAFHGDLKGLLKAAMAMLLWGDKVRILSTHNGADSAFNDLIQEVRAGKRKGHVHRITFREAVAQGLFKRVCLRRGLEWTQALEDKWVADAYAYYGDDADEELDVVPSLSGGAFLPMALIEARMSSETPLVRGRWKSGFALEPEYARNAEVEEWCARELKPHLDAIGRDARCALGGDCGRVADLSVFSLLAEQENLVQRCVLQVELSNCPFKQQEQILFYILDYVRDELRLKAGALDAAGIGAPMAEAAAQRYGALVIEQVKPSEKFYIEQMPKFKAAFEDATLEAIPRDRETRDDLRAIRVINGVPKLPKEKTQRAGGEKLTRHGDAAIAHFLAHYAAKRDVVPIEFQQLGQQRVGAQLADFHME